jgi:hypothetical protein
MSRITIQINLSSNNGTEEKYCPELTWVNTGTFKSFYAACAVCHLSTAAHGSTSNK